MATKANYKPLSIDDEVLSRMQTNIQQAFSNLDQPSGQSVKTVTSQYQVSNDDDVILADPTSGSFIITLPDPSTITKSISLCKIGASANAVTVQPSSPRVLISGSAKVALTSLRLVTSATAYWIIA